MFEQSLVLSEIDFVRLNKLDTEKETEWLNDLLEAADIKNCACVPDDLITMNTRLSYVRLSDNKVSEIKIVYPQFADLSKNLISVLSPLGRAFIGRYKGEIVGCELPDGTTSTLKILEILYQPEANGEFHL